MERHKIWAQQAIAVLLLFLVSACGATKVQLPMNIAEQIKAGGYQMPQYQADMQIAMNDDDAALRYMAAIHDIKLQLNIGEAYKQNLLEVMDIMFANTEFGSTMTHQNKTGTHSKAYVLDAAFQFVRVTIPRTRFGKTQAHVVTKYTLYDPAGNKLFSYTDYTYGAKSNALLMSPVMKAVAHGEGGLARNAMQYTLLTSITKISGIIQQYMNAEERDAVLKAIAVHEQELADGATSYSARIKNGDYLEKSKAAAEIRGNFALLAVAQNALEKELLLLAGQELESRYAKATAKELCATLAITGRKKYLQTFQHIAANAKDNGLRSLGQKYYNYLLKSLCGSGDCVAETKG